MTDFPTFSSHVLARTDYSVTPGTVRLLIRHERAAWQAGPPSAHLRCGLITTEMACLIYLCATTSNGHQSTMCSAVLTAPTSLIVLLRLTGERPAGCSITGATAPLKT